MEWKWSLSFNISKSPDAEPESPKEILRHSKVRKVVKQLGALHELSQTNNKTFVRVLFDTKEEGVQAQKILQSYFEKRDYIAKPMVLRRHQY